MATESLLLSLPEELIVTIASFCALPDILSFGLTSKTAHRCSLRRLTTQQASHTQYCISHDRQPLTMPSLLRWATSKEGSQEWERAWHVKTVEFWDVRYKWDHWKTTSFPDSPPVFDEVLEKGVQPWLTLEPAEDHSSLDETFFDDEELQKYEGILLNCLGFPESDLGKWYQSKGLLRQLRKGCDGVLKGMTIAQLPIPRKLNLLGHLDTNKSDVDNCGACLVAFLQVSITQIIESRQTPQAIPWPVGFQSLREITFSNHVDYDLNPDGFPMSFLPEEVAPFFRLPNIKILNFQDMDEDGTWGSFMDGYWNLLPVSCSTVEELSFKNCNFDDEAVGSMVESCKNLKKFAWQNSSALNGHVADALKMYQYSSIEEIVGAPWGMFAKELRCLRKLKVIDDIHLDNFFHRSVKRASSPAVLQAADEYGSSTCLAKQLFPSTVQAKRAWQSGAKFEVQCVDIFDTEIVDLRRTLPRTIEKLSISARRPGSRYATHVYSHRVLQQAIADLVEDPQFICLKLVCVWHLEKANYEEEYLYGSGSKTFDWDSWYDWDEKALQRIESSGVEFHRYMIGEKKAANDKHPQHGGGCPCMEPETDPRSNKEIDQVLLKASDEWARYH